jgi:hypothetical protein
VNTPLKSKVVVAHLPVSHVTKLPPTPFDWSISTYTPAASPRTREPLPCYHLLPQDIVTFSVSNCYTLFELLITNYLATLLVNQTGRKHPNVIEDWVSYTRQCRHGIDNQGLVWTKMRTRSVDCGIWSERVQRRLIVWWYVLIFFSFSCSLYVSCFESLFSLCPFESVHTRGRIKAFGSSYGALRAH